MIDPAGNALTKSESQRRPEPQAASGFPPRVRRPDSSVGVAASGLADEERARLALDHGEGRAAPRGGLLVRGRENELFTPAVEQHYAALQEAEASAAALEAQLLWSHQRGESKQDLRACFAELKVGAVMIKLSRASQFIQY